MFSAAPAPIVSIGVHLPFICLRPPVSRRRRCDNAAMTQVPEPVEFCLPPALDPVAVVDALGRRVSVVPGSWSSADRVYLDTFDGRLRAAGITLSRVARPPRDGAVHLTLADAGPRRHPVAVVPTRPDRIMVEELPAGSVRDRLQGLIGERALLTRVRVRSREQPVSVRNRDGKTVARMTIEQPVAVLPNRDNGTFGCRVHLVPVLGYERAFKKVVKVLEAKVGLKLASTSLVDEAMAAAGVPVVDDRANVPLERGMRADHASLLVCRRLADIVEANLPGTLGDIDTEFLHDLRVAVRRTRSVLKEMKGVLPSEAAARARVDLKWMQAVTGPTRDLDVQLHEWPQLVAPVSPAMAADLPPLYGLLQRHRAAAYRTMCRQLRSRRYREAWAAWRALLDEPLTGGDARSGPRAGMPVDELAGRRIASVYQAMVKLGSAIDSHSPPEALHDLRKRGKELRYLLELFGGLWPPHTVQPLVSTLKDLQEVLGRFQDDAIQTTRLRELGPELAAAPGGTDSLIALGLVIDTLAANQHEARKAFAQRFAPFAASKTRKLVKATFA